MATDYGTDLNFAGLDLSPTGDMVSGTALLEQAILIRLSTGRSVIDSPDDGIDLTDELSRGMSPPEVATLGGRIEQEIVKDERFRSCKCTVDASRLITETRLTLTLELDAGDGPFDLVLSAGKAGLEILGGS